MAEGHITEAPVTIMYASRVSRETVRIVLMTAALNDLEVKSGDILNANVQVPVTEKVWTTLGSEFGKDARKTAVIVRALYDLKSAGAASRSHLARCMKSMGYQSCKADTDLWFQSEVRPEDGVKYYSYILGYVGDILCIHHNTDSILKQLHKSFPLKPGFGKPVMYLGAKLQKTRLHNEVWTWAMSLARYVQEAVSNCKVHPSSNYGGKYRLPKKQRIHLRWVMIQS